MKREQEAREIESDELRNLLNNTKGSLEEKILREKQILRDSLDQDCMDINNRLDKLNLDRMNDLGDIQAKIALFGKSAQRHLDALKHFVVRECQNLFDLATKPASVVFDAFRYTLQLSRINLTYQEQAISG